MGGGDQGAQQALQNLAGLLLLPRRHRPRIRHRRLLLCGPTARLNFPDCVPEYCHQDLSAAAIRKKATEDVVLYCKCFRKKGIISYNINNLNLEENESRDGARLHFLSGDGMKNYPAAPAYSILDTSFDFSNYTTVTIPTVSFAFSGGVKIDLIPSGILISVCSTVACLAFAGNGDTTDTGIFGNTQQLTFEVVYDVAGGKLGFGATGC
ncbi:hypothetical protein SASPL_150725 [Salvia splendens]|uniref:Xylanase inhibitor C-terminal domain-containing protein n=1 Tax=Salvia splendens TaxID=180675 RepID=A0A8X8W723_SALSN|nr:hypothetical protein SASPL_150725 [Salvia splendens]